MKALCLIDVQKDFTKTDRSFAFPPEDTARVIGNANALIAKAAAENVPIIYVRQVNSSLPARLFARVFGQGLAISGNPGIEIDPRVTVVGGNVFDKERPDAFTSRSFKAFLEDKGIDDLLLMGLDGCMCVNSTARGALKKGLRVTIVEDAVISSFPRWWAKKLKRLSDLGALVTSSTSIESFR